MHTLLMTHVRMFQHFLYIYIGSLTAIPLRENVYITEYYHKTPFAVGPGTAEFLCSLTVVFVPGRSTSSSLCTVQRESLGHWLLIEYVDTVYEVNKMFRLPSPLDSILDAVLTVSPNRQYLGIFKPTTPGEKQIQKGSIEQITCCLETDSKMLQVFFFFF